MKHTLMLASLAGLVPAIAIAVVAPAIAPFWLVPPAIAFAVLLAVTAGLVRWLGLALGFLLRLVVWLSAWAMIIAAAYAMAIEPAHVLLAWLIIVASVLALAATPPPRGPRLADRTH